MKFYVVCGQLRYVTMAPTYLQACMNMLSSGICDGHELAQLFYVDERGFRDNTLGEFGPAAGCFIVQEVLNYMHNGGCSCDDGCV